MKINISVDFSDLQSYLDDTFKEVAYECAREEIDKAIRKAVREAITQTDLTGFSKAVKEAHRNAVNKVIQTIGLQQ